MLWTYSILLPFCQIIEDSNCLFSENKHFDHNLSGRYALNWNDSQECSDVLRYNDPRIAEAGVCYKSKRVGDDPLTGNGVCGYDNKLQRDDYLSSREESSKSELQYLICIRVHKCQFYS